MPRIIVGTGGRRDIGEVKSKDFDYDYPDDLDLKPGSRLHNSIVDKVIELAAFSQGEISSQFPRWRKIDNVLTAYIEPDEEERAVKAGDSRKPTSIVFPYSYSIMDALLTYMTMAFIREPIFKYEAVAGKDYAGGVLLEAVIHQHCTRSKTALKLHTLFRDNFAYGRGYSIPAWEVRTGKRSQITRTEHKIAGMAGDTATRVRNDVTLFEGNTLHSINPYLALPDPNVSASDVQKGEFFGWLETSNLMTMLNDELETGDLFNVRYLKYAPTLTSSFMSEDATKANAGRDRSRNDGAGITQPIDSIAMYVNLIPAEWDLGDSEYPEKWLFRVSADSILIQAAKLDFDHQMFPVVCASSDDDGRSPTPVSKLETLYGLQEVGDWLFNCYDEETEVLTNHGWQKISTAKLANNKVATVDPNTMDMWLETPSEWFEYSFDGELVQFKSKRHDLLVTPNHSMFGKYRYDAKGKGRHFKLAGKLFGKNAGAEFKIPVAANWIGDSCDLIRFAAIKPKRDRGCKLRYPEILIDPIDMASFLGWVLSDGGICLGKTSGSYSINIKQSKQENFSLITETCETLGFHVSDYYNEAQKSMQWTISDKRLFGWIYTNCYKAGTTGEYKQIPAFIRDGNSELIHEFMFSFITGDGHVNVKRNNLVDIGTESIYLADQIQELAVKIGWSCAIRPTILKSGKSFWKLSINKNAPDSTVTAKGTKLVPYTGKVYCFTNSTHLTVVRRNGKVCLCGQSHMTNVRKSINNMLIVDPNMVNMNDLRDPGPGKLVRLRRPAWGRGVDGVIKQLKIDDITRGNIGETGFINGAMQTAAGTDASMMGTQRSGGPERVTKGEFQGTRSSAMNRLERTAMIIGLQAMQDLGMFFASNTQQFMSEQTYVKIAGGIEEDLAKELGVERGRIRVKYQDLLIDYDVRVRDGSIPGGNFSDSWLQMFKILSDSPEIGGQFDMVRIFMHIARNLGAKNVDDFKKLGAPQVMPDQGVQDAVQAGNLVPVGGE